MFAEKFHKLNNPAWFSLVETHAPFSIGDNEIKRYQNHIAPFVAFSNEYKTDPFNFNDWVLLNESFFLIGDLPAIPINYSIESKLLCVQMVCTSPANVPSTASLHKLNNTYETQMSSLVNMVQPGYYKPGTRLMGDYYGIFNNEQLVSMAGERMRMNGFTEISAVVTHPQFTGLKYAQQLIALLVNKNLKAGIIPFLHVAETNVRAIKLYEHLGFYQRRMIAFWKIKRNN